MRLMIRIRGWLHSRLARAGDRGWSTLEAVLLLAAAGAAALAVVAAFNDAFDPLLEDFENTFGGD